MGLKSCLFQFFPSYLSEIPWLWMVFRFCEIWGLWFRLEYAPETAPTAATTAAATPTPLISAPTSTTILHSFRHRYFLGGG